VTKTQIGKTAVRIVETKRGRHILEQTPRYKVLLDGEEFGELYFNMSGYVGYLPLPGGHKIDIGERSISTFRREIVAVNREFRVARAKAPTPNSPVSEGSS